MFIVYHKYADNTKRKIVVFWTENWYTIIIRCRETGFTTRRVEKGVFMKKTTRYILTGFIAALVLCVYYYVALPAVNIHYSGCWFFVIGLTVLFLVIYMARRKTSPKEAKESKVVRWGVRLLLVIVLVYVVGSVLSSPIVNAKKYRNLLKVEEGEFTESVEQISTDKIPLLDRESAQILGNRKMGSMVDMVSQFEVSDLYTQINYQNRPVRVTPLEYASPVKWLTNRSEGIPAYIKIDMATQNTELVKLDEGIKYSQSEYFNRNIYRHLRFRYPTYIFDELSFEIDEEGTPYWVCPVQKYTIGLFGGQVIGRVVLCNAVTGETKDYAFEDVPQWVDRAYSADLMVELYDYYGSLKHGFLNSVLGQRDCLKTTDGYNFLALDDDIWVYTGVTSVSGDQSNVGFVLMNQRTMETKYYKVEGATESSAMSSAEGQVQNLKYTATFPLLLNIAEQPTYFIALKDAAGLVKKYAMVNVQKYQLVAIGDTVTDCEATYMKLLETNGIAKKDETKRKTERAAGTIKKIAQTVVDGNSHFYLILEDSDAIYDVSASDFLEVVLCDVGDEVTLEYEPGEQSNNVTALKREKASGQ